MKTEEDVKIKIVLPFLKFLGFHENELSFEKSFTLQIGRRCYNVNTEEQFQTTRARLDILITRDGTNLFIVEVKKAEAKITEKDIMQATSYARLLHPIAPFAIVTNGNEFNIYDSLSMEKIPNDNFPLRDYYNSNISDEVKYNALKYFFRFTKENLLLFCQEQVHEAMITLKGSKDNPSKKFIPELYTPRKSLSQVFANFINDETTPVFAIVGDSGSGKTSSMCYTALKLLDNGNPVLFYKASNLVWDITQSIADDFNWSVSTQSSGIQIIKQVAEIVEPNKLVLFVEAVDEWNNNNRVEIINNFITKIRKRNIKLVLSCKSNAWNYFLQQRDTPSELSEFTYKNNKGKQGFSLGDFDWEEFSDALSKYSSFYNYNGTFEKRVLDECQKSPFFLRVCFEVAQQYNLRRLTFSCKDFFHAYYKRLINKIGNETVAMIADSTLKGVAKCLFDNNCDSIEIDSVKDFLGLNVNDNILPSLFEYNILEVIAGPSAFRVRFYFDKLRDYVIAFRVLKLDESSRPFDNLLRDNIHKEVLIYYYTLAETSQQKTIDSPMRENAEKYLAFYIKVIEDNFSQFRQGFPPHTTGGIGFIGGIDIINRLLFMYGFRALNDSNDDKIKLIPCDRVQYKESLNDIYFYGARKLHHTSSSNYFWVINIESEILKNEIEPQLNDIAKYGLLNECNNLFLLKEKIIAIITSNEKYFEIRGKMNLSKQFPIDFEDIEYVLNYKRAYKYYEDKLIQDKIDNGIIKPEWKGSIQSCTCSLTENDIVNIHNFAEYSADNNVRVKPISKNDTIMQIENSLIESMISLKHKNIFVIDEPIIPKSDNFNMSGWVWDNYTFETLKLFIHRMYLLFLNEYKTIIETNFELYKECFKLYSLMPLKCFITHRYNKEWFGIYYCCNDDSKNNEVTLCLQDDIIVDDCDRELTYLNKRYKLHSYRHSAVGMFFGGSSSFTKIRIRSNLAPIRTFVYEQIQSEIHKVSNALFLKYGQKRN